MPETASPGTHNARTVRLASALAAKIRRGERTATSRWRQGPRRASLENTSAAAPGDDRGEQREEPAARERQHYQRAGPACGVHLAAEEGVRRKRALPADHD